MLQEENQPRFIAAHTFLSIADGPETCSHHNQIYSNSTMCVGHFRKSDDHWQVAHFVSLCINSFLLYTFTMTLFGPLGPSLAPWVRSFKGIRRLVKSHADWYANIAGYRKLGLKYDDLCECNPRSFV